MTRQEYLVNLGFKNKYPSKYGVYELENNGIKYIIYYLKNRKDYAVSNSPNIELNIVFKELDKLRLIFNKFIELKNN